MEVKVQFDADTADSVDGFGWVRTFIGDMAAVSGQDDGVLIVRATRKLLDRVGGPNLPDGAEPTTLLGEWYATLLTWRPQVVLLVNELTLLPVLMPLAPASTLTSRIPGQIAGVLTAQRTPGEIVSAESQQMSDCCFAKTANRSVVGVMNEFAFLADAWRGPNPDLLTLAMRLAETPCGPLYRRNISPDRELAALVASIAVPGWIPSER